MRKFFSKAFVVAAMLALVACGGSSDGSKFETPGTPGGGNGGPQTGPTVSSVIVVASTPSLPSNGSTPVEISAFVRDSSNQFMEGETVVFSADSGGLQITQATTDANGLAKATLTTAGDPSNRAIEVTAAVGAVTGTATINVSGSQLSIQGANALVIGQSAVYTIALIDSGGTGIANKEVQIASARSNTLSATTVTTNSSGQATFTMTVANTGNDTITATGLGLTSTLAVSVNSDSFSFVTPNEKQEIPLGKSEPVTVRWTQNNVPMAGQVISFATTRGTLSSSTATTDGTGSATVNVTSTNAGGAVITASAAGGAASQRPVEFVATSAATIDVQPSAFSIAPMEISTITAVVRDAENNLVKNQTVTFSLQDVTGGTLSTASAVTDSQGRAQTAYTAGSVASAQNGVAVTATVLQSTPSAPTVNKTVKLTVAQRQLFLVLGTGNEIAEPNTAQYQLAYIVQVTDANGAGVSGVPLTLSVLSVDYFKGTRVKVTDGWSTSIAAICPDEDSNHNGVLDLSLDEDYNSSGRIEAGNIATVSPGTATSGANGFVTVSVFYPQEYAYYLKVTLEARASVQGTEFARSSTFILPGLDSDFNGDGAPPGPDSPFGVKNDCQFRD
jgi:hypothetical protein